MPHRMEMRRRLWLVGVVLLGLAIRAPLLDEPLLEGAAAKQTHTAMVARNLYRGRGSWQRPMVDDVGPPGYFVKELPLVPGTAALAYALLGGPHEAVGRALGVLAWLAAVPLLVRVLRRERSDLECILAALWLVSAPLAIAYSCAFMTDPAMIAASLAALAAGLAWRERPTLARAAVLAACTALALLLKPHAAFWLAPGLWVALIGRAAPSEARPRRRELAVVFLCLSVAAGVAAAWYAHAARIHRQFPVPGAMVAGGWVDAALWLEPALYAEVAQQIAAMVFTPAGLALTAIALWRPRPRFGHAERALLWWGAGAVAQSIVLGTRVFDATARGTEYYQLALVPVAAMLVARGGARVVEVFAARSPSGGRWAALGVAAALALGGIAGARPALAAPARYAGLLADCAEVRSLTPPEARLFVLADRGGTVLYYCDRRGTTFTAATPLTAASAAARAAAGPEALWRALEGATYVFLPFPDTTPPELAQALARDWRRIPTSNPAVELWARPDAARPGGPGSGA